MVSKKFRISWQHLGASCSRVPNANLTEAVDNCPTMSKSLVRRTRGCAGAVAGTLGSGKGRRLGGPSSSSLGATTLQILGSGAAALVALYLICSGVKGALFLGVSCKGALPSVAYISLSEETP